VTTTYMTEPGVRKLRQQLSTKLAEHASLCEERKTAHTLSGDGWHDNPYHDRLQQLEAEKTREIVALRQQLDSARVVAVDPNRRPLEKVQIGSIVTLRIEDESGRERIATWEITGFGETDVSSNQLGYNTPLAQAVLGEPIGSEVLANLPGGSVLITVVALLAGWHGADARTFAGKRG
jgi:transcription elongation GreA/GreB family factor